MVEDDSDSSEFVWVNDDRDDGDGHVVIQGTGLSSSSESEEHGTEVQMQLPDELVEEVTSMYDDLDEDFYQRYGERLEPNQLFWANGVRVMLNNADELKKQIGIR